MLKSQKKLVRTLAHVSATLAFLVLAMLLVPQYNPVWTKLFPGIVAAILFFIIEYDANTVEKNVDTRLEKKILYTEETSFLTTFINKLRFCYSLDDFYSAISTVLEEQADCSVLFIDSSKNYILYNSPDRLTCLGATRDKLELNFPASWPDGMFFIGDTFGLVSSYKEARGFFLSSSQQHLYVFCRYTKLFDISIYNSLFDEFVRFQSRSHTVSDLSEIAELSKEWEQLAATQKSFLPQTMPNVRHLKLASYFRPLVNVSGDYYSVLPIDQYKTLVMLGDVSGKGLPAALIMGLVMNTVKIIEDKEDLVSMVYAIDKAIKGMHLQDKYTVLFLGIIDTKDMRIRYINASMSDPLVISRSPDGARIKPLESNCGVIGIIELNNVQVSERRLFRGDLIMMATDGVSEVMDDSGKEFGDTPLYMETLKRSSVKQPEEFVKDVVDTLFVYNGDKKLRDDVTMLIAKVEG